MHYNFLEGYSFAIPVAYGDTIRLQHFSPGDVFYDTKAAYELSWGDALKQIRTCIQVGEVFSTQKIKIKIYTPNQAQNALQVVSEKEISAETLKGILISGNIQ